MKKLWILAVSVFLALPVIALAQDPAQGNDTMKQDHDTMKQSPSGKTSVKGTLSEDGKTLVSDSDGKSWTVANPDAVKGHEGHHVELKGSADASTGQIQVTGVKMLKGAKTAAPKDSTQPPQ